MMGKFQARPVNDTVLDKIRTLNDELAKWIRDVEERLGTRNRALPNLKNDVMVAVLSDGFSGADDRYCDLFVRGNFSRKARTVRFRRMPVTSKLEECDTPVVLISDNNEIDNNIRGRVMERVENGKVTFPVIIFSDDFFVPREGEHFAYLDIIEAYERAVEKKVMAFRESDIGREDMYISAYVVYVEGIMKLRSAVSTVREALDCLTEEIEAFSNEAADENISVLRRLAANIAAKSRNALREDFLRWEKEANEKEKGWEGIPNFLRESHDTYVLGLINGQPVRASSPLAVEMNLKYGKTEESFLKYLDTFQKANLQRFGEGFFSRSPEEIIRETEEDVCSHTSELTLVGTFSSGKTTLINTLLGHKHKLPTSMGHNTAVLMKLIHTDGEECYNVVYRKKFMWTLVKPDSYETKIIRNPFCTKARVLSVTEHGKGKCIELQPAGNSKPVQRIVVGAQHKLKYKKGDIVPAEGILIENKESGSTLRLATKNELMFIDECICKGKVRNPKIHIVFRIGLKDKEVSGSEQVQHFIKKMLSLPQYGTTNPDRPPSVSREFFSKSIGIGGDVIRSEFEADLDLPNSCCVLNENGWLNFCGKEENGKWITHPFSERPACYMIADHIDVYLKSKFLDYCTVNDTPGFGSVSEEHDSVTERFIASNKGRLLVMIAINSKTRDIKLSDLLIHITNIYQNNKKDRMNEVFFMLNCYANNAPEQQLSSSVEKMAREIKEQGFPLENVYVCNLRKSIEDRQEMNQMYGFPSYVQFKKQCITQMLDADMERRYVNIGKAWEEFFSESIDSIKERQRQCESDLKNREKRKEELERQIVNVDAVRPESAELIIESARARFGEYYDSLHSAFTWNRKGGFIRERERYNACMEVIGRMEEDVRENEESENIRDLYVRAFDKLAYESGIEHGNSGSYTSYESSEKENLFVISIETLKGIIEEADTETYWFNKSGQTSLYMGKIKDILVQDFEDAEDKVRAHCRNCDKKFKNRKRNDLAALNQNLQMLQDSKMSDIAIKNCKEALNVLDELKSLFNRTVNYKF